MDEQLSFTHRFEPARRPGVAPLLLLHGTGGNEDDLLPLGRMIAPDAALLSPRGKVLESGMPRFFRRVRAGVFDEDDVRRRANELADFVEAARKAYAIASPIALGYSNGANTAAAILLLRPSVLAAAVLLRATLPFLEPPRPELAGKSVLILSGTSDALISVDGATRLAAALKDAGAQVEHRTLPVGHELSQADVSLARRWLDQQIRRRRTRRRRVEINSLSLLSSAFRLRWRSDPIWPACSGLQILG
jgi:phospholipase/carboxylesterase